MAYDIVKKSWGIAEVANDITSTPEGLKAKLEKPAPIFPAITLAPLKIEICSFNESFSGVIFINPFS